MYSLKVHNICRNSLLSSWNHRSSLCQLTSACTTKNVSQRVLEKWFHCNKYNLNENNKCWNGPIGIKKGKRNCRVKMSCVDYRNNRNQLGLSSHNYMNNSGIIYISQVNIKEIHTFRNPLVLSCPINMENFPKGMKEHKRFSTKNIRGRLFYKRRPKQIPILKRKNWRSKWLEGAPQKKGICLKVRVQTPKKPNSGLKKIARVRLSTGRIVSVYIPGIGHNLNTHSIILVRGGRCKDIPGCNYKAVRGVYDLLPVKNRFRGRSKYGVKLSEEKRKHLVERYNFKHITIQKDIEEFNKYKWFNYVDKDKNLREKPLEEGENVPINIFHFNTYYRKKKFQQEHEK